MSAPALRQPPVTAPAVLKTYGWNWPQFAGSAAALKFARRDLVHLDAAIARAPQRRVAVQAGGSLGIYPKRLAQRFESVITFEPAADLFPLLLQNAPEPNIVRLQVALGYHRQLVGMSRVRRDGKPQALAHEGITHVSGPGSIPTLRLDDLALPVCDLVSLDVEGWELYALQGATDTIARCRPVLSIEINRNCEFVGLTRDRVRAFILAQGYRFVERLSSDEVFVPQEWPV